MKTKRFLRAFALLAGVSLAACTDKDKSPVEPKFPEIQTFTVNAGETKSLSFEANTQWTLSSGKNWCVIMDGEEETLQKTGEAGAVSFTIKVKDTNHNFDEDAIAELTLSMKGVSNPKVIFEIERPAKERAVTMYEKANNVFNIIEEVELEFQINRTAYYHIGFTANFDWKVLSKTEGITLSEELFGTANQDVSEIIFAIIELEGDKLPEPFSGEIVISDLSGEKTFTFPVTYAGMGDNDMFFSEPYLIASFQARVTFSGNGYVMSKEAIPVPTENKAFSFTAITHGMQSQGFVVTLNNGTPEIAADPWLILTDNGNGNYSMAVAGDGINPGDARDMYVFVFPEALATSGNPNLSPYFTDGEIKGKYGFKVSQEAAPIEGGFFVGWGLMQTSVAAGQVVPFGEYPMFEGMVASEFQLGLPNDNTYVYEFSTADIDGSLAIAPLGLDEEYPMPAFTGYSGDWGSVNKEPQMIGDNFGISLGGINSVTDMRIGILQFDVVNYQASAAIILIQKP